MKADHLSQGVLDFIWAGRGNITMLNQLFWWLHSHHFLLCYWHMFTMSYTIAEADFIASALFIILKTKIISVHFGNLKYSSCLYTLKTLTPSLRLSPLKTCTRVLLEKKPPDTSKLQRASVHKSWLPYYSDWFNIKIEVLFNFYNGQSITCSSTTG
jgi:hypothetical protein